LAAARQHQQFPLPRLAEQLDFRTEAAGASPFDVSFAVLRSPPVDQPGVALLQIAGAAHRFSLGELSIEGVDLSAVADSHPQDACLNLQFGSEVLPASGLGLTLAEAAGTVVGCWNYDAGRFRPKTVARINERYGELLRRIVAAPLLQLLYPAALASTLLFRRVEWRRVHHQIDGPWHVRLVEYRPYRGDGNDGHTSL